MKTSAWRRREFQVFAALVAFLIPWSPRVDAFIDTPVFVPTQPIETTPTAVDIRSGVCDGAAFNLDGDLFDVQISNHDIELTISFLHTIGGGIFCIVPIAIDRFSLGQLPAGVYTLRTYSISSFTSFPPPPGSRTLLFTQNFTVLGSAPVSVPGSGPIPRLILVVLLMLLGVFAIAPPNKSSKK